MNSSTPGFVISHKLVSILADRTNEKKEKANKEDNFLLHHLENARATTIYSSVTAFEKNLSWKKHIGGN